MFFKRPIKEIEYNDVLDFCATKTKENEVLDYKEDFPKKFEKTIAAFANTFGGLIIVGVAEEDGFPVDNPSGIKYTNGLEERVTNIVISNIYPAIFPDIQVCKPVKGKTFVLIQIAQSSNTPHSIANRTKVYLRTGNVSKPERLVDMDELHWLTRNREVSTDLRHSIRERAFDQYNILFKQNKVTLDFAEMTLNISPIYPKYLKINLPELKNEIVNLSVRTSGGSNFPSFPVSKIRTTQGGVFLFRHDKGIGGEFTEYTFFHKIGLLYHTQDIGRYLDNKEQTLYLMTIMSEYQSFLLFYKNLIDKIGIWGDYLVIVLLTKVEGLRVVPVGFNNFRSELPDPYPRISYSYEGILHSSDFVDKKSIDNEVLDLAEDLHWSFDVARSRDNLNLVIKEKLK